MDNCKATIWLFLNRLHSVAVLPVKHEGQSFLPCRKTKHRGHGIFIPHAAAFEASGGKVAVVKKKVA